MNKIKRQAIFSTRRKNRENTQYLITFFMPFGAKINRPCYTTNQMCVKIPQASSSLSNTRLFHKVRVLETLQQFSDRLFFIAMSVTLLDSLVLSLFRKPNHSLVGRKLSAQRFFSRERFRKKIPLQSSVSKGGCKALSVKK